jgi:hypothetical protein
MKVEQLSNQTYDLERVIKENKELTGKIQQLSTLSESRQYQSS